MWRRAFGLFFPFIPALSANSFFEYTPPSFSSFAASVDPSTPLQQVILPQPFADSFGAKCLNGSPPSYYYLNQNSSRWILFIEGGGWCFTLQSCLARSLTLGGSSQETGSMVVGGLLSPDPKINPDFYTSNFAFIHYCDGSSHSSNATLPITVPPSNRTIWMRGRPNLQAVVSHLLQAGMASAHEIILSGGSAGGTSAFLALDHVAGLLATGAPAARFVGAPDAGFFVDAAVYYNASQHAFRAEFQSADLFWNSTASGGLNAACLAAFPTERWRCFFPENAAPFLRTPFHAMMANYDLASLSMIYGLPCLPPKCSPEQLTSLLAWKAQFLAQLQPAVAALPGNGAYTDSCLVHEQNVDYCSGQSVPNCRGWNIYNVSAYGYPQQLTPQQGFSVWYSSLMANWEATMAAREAALQAPAPAAALRAASKVAIYDTLEWPHNPSCPWGT